MTKAASASKPCPLCGAPASARYRPFCSERCANLDLSRWLKGVYVIEGAPASEDEGEEAPVRPPREDNH